MRVELQGEGEEFEGELDDSLCLPLLEQLEALMVLRLELTEWEMTNFRKRKRVELLERILFFL